MRALAATLLAVVPALAALPQGSSVAGEPARAGGTDLLVVPTGPDLPRRTPMARRGTAAASTDPISRRRLRRTLRSEIEGVGGSSGAWVAELDPSPGPVFRHRASARRILASNTKLFSTGAFLDRLGARGRLRTRAFARPSRRRGVDGRVLRGALALVGNGDPALASPRFAEANGLPLTPLRRLANRVQRAGIEVVRRGVVVDDTVLDRIRGTAATGWTAGPYVSPLSGLSYNSGYEGGAYSSAPELVAGRAFVRMLARRGIRVRDKVWRGDLSADRLRTEPPVATVASPPAGRLVATTNKHSNNFFAEMLIKRAAATHRRPGTTERGARLAERFAARFGVEPELSDGSGLGRSNRASPAEVGRLLVGMARHHRDSRFFRRSLAIAGRSGTLAERMRGTAAEGSCRAKTGTLSGVSALSGYCKAGERRLAFSILMNDVEVNAAREAQDRMVAAIARYSG